MLSCYVLLQVSLHYWSDSICHASSSCIGLLFTVRPLGLLLLWSYFLAYIQLFLLKCVRNGRLIYLLRLTRAFVPCNVQSHWRTINRPISWSLTRSLRIILQYIVQFSHIKARYMQLLRQQFPNLNFSVERVFCHLCSCANRERALKGHPAWSWFL